MIRLATDVGGTFTDLVAYDEATGRLTVGKSLTTTDDPSRGVLHVIEAAAAREDLDATSAAYFVHGGTTVINAITERKGVKTALVTTAGFRDVLAIGRGARPDLYNLRTRSPEPFIPRDLRFEVRERLDARGEVVAPLHEEDLAPIAEACRAAGVEAVGVVFLHAYANPAHERAAADALAAALPEATVCASHEISRQWREFERSSTVALNAYVQPILQRYLARLEDALDARGIRAPRYAMLSNGGVAAFAQARRTPLALVESGPSGGVAGAAAIGRLLGETEVLHLDVGGTTAKCSLIEGGRIRVEDTYKLEKTRLTPGHPIQTPVIDIVEIGAGGGSIAWLDPRGALRVGPRSAGSTPGPACYGRGGTDPTVTDALVTLGIFDPQAFAGGDVPLDVALARHALKPLADHLQGSVEAAAHAVVEIALANMNNALKLVTVQRGRDPRDAAFVISGGAGPALAARLGRELSVKTTVAPPHPGIFSAWGMLAAQPRADFRATWFAPLDPEAMAGAADRFAALEAEAEAHFAAASASPVTHTRALEARYAGQEHGVMAPWGPGDDAARFAEGFHATHERAYTFRLDVAEIEITGLHLEARLETGLAVLAPLSPEGRSLDAARKGERQVWLSPEAGWTPCPVYDRDRLPLDQPLPGPLIVEEATTTTLVLPGQTARLDPGGCLLIREG
ncbi:MAG: hydantoinase/oxoprolinase family protein [Pseudomonadota bacterium]